MSEPDCGKRVTFCELFAHHSHVEIPIIQRDYAQGRDSAVEVRSYFLDAMYSALLKEPGDATLPLDLDFVYGSMEGPDSASFCPLDGQQRLTTLFLLHWYLAWADGMTTHFTEFAKQGGRSRFAYAVRASSGEFFDRIVSWFPAAPPVEVTSLTHLIEDQPWFFQWWRRDPTVQSALAMLESIHERFRESEGFYNRLVISDMPYITFQLLDLAHFGLSDDLYIKMNARGKPLTIFETFKAQLEKHIGVVFPEPNARQLSGQQLTLKEYFSRQIDTTWAELFWTYRDKTTNLFDEQIMNLIRAVGIVTRDSVVDGVDRVSFQKYLDINCLDRSHIDLLIRLLDAWSGSEGKICTYLPDCLYFNELQTFKVLLDGKPTYVNLLQFCAYAEFLRKHGTAPRADRFNEWMRVIKNLTINSNIERPEEFHRSLRSVLELLKNSDNILAFLTKNDSRVQGFSVQQIREERIKAGLILKSERWKAAVLEAEQHGYFKGQIEFLLDFSGVLDTWNKKGSCEWSDDEDGQYLERFISYNEKSCRLFSDDGLIQHGELLTERALLAIGDYTFEKSQNKSFLGSTTDGSISWKRLLRGDLNGSNAQRNYLRSLLDHIDLSKEIDKSLKDVIDAMEFTMTWRALLVKNPELMEFCAKRQFRFCSPWKIYLLKGERRNGEHADLFTYDLYKRLCKKIIYIKRNFVDLRYETVRTDTSEPHILLTFNDNNWKLELKVESDNEEYKFLVSTVVCEIPDAMSHDLEKLFGCLLSAEVQQKFPVEMDSVDEFIIKIFQLVIKYVDGSN